MSLAITPVVLILEIRRMSSSVAFVSITLGHGHAAGSTPLPDTLTDPTPGSANAGAAHGTV